MEQYHQFLKTILKDGTPKTDRTGTGTRSIFGYQMRFNLNDGFPLLTTKKVHFKSVILELLWFIQGATNIRPLVLEGVRIWNEWPFAKFQADPSYQGESMETFIEMIKNDEAFAQKFGELGPVYGKQWRGFEGKDNVVDQLAQVIDDIKLKPDSRRLIVNAWNPPLVDQMALPPCHMMFQFYVADGELSLQMYQRSADAFLGIPFNIASYSALLLMVAQITKLKAKDFILTVGDGHIYNDHFEAVDTLLQREERPLPSLKLNPAIQSIDDFTFEDFILEDYHPHPTIKAKVSV
jgi:thymidylate synthase